MDPMEDIWRRTYRGKVEGTLFLILKQRGTYMWMRRWRKAIRYGQAVTDWRWWPALTEQDLHRTAFKGELT